MIKGIVLLICVTVFFYFCVIVEIIQYRKTKPKANKTKTLAFPKLLKFSFTKTNVPNLISVINIVY